MFLGKIRNRLTRFEKQRIEFNAKRAAAIERHKKKGKQLGKTDVIIPDHKEKKSYTQKEWNRFGSHQKDILSNRYDVTLKGYETKREKWVRRGKAVNLKNFDRVMTKFDKGSKQFFSEFDKGFKTAGFKESRVYPSRTDERNIATIFGSRPKETKKSKKSREQKTNNITTIFGSKKSKSKDRVF